MIIPTPRGGGWHRGVTWPGRTRIDELYLAADYPKPEAAIYMAGTGNGYGHPHAETITALQAIGATIYGTDVKGDIVVTTDGQTYNVTTEK